MGNAINLAIRWAKEVNGDRIAKMTIEKIGSTGMRLTTVDTDPKTGKSVVTSQINLRRASSPSSVSFHVRPGTVRANLVEAGKAVA